MSKVSFHYNFKRDAWSWVCFAKRRSNIWGLKQRLDFIPPNLLKEIRKRNKKTAEKLVYNYLINNPKKQIRRILIRQEINVLQNIWRRLESKFFKRLEKITQRPIFTSCFKNVARFQKIKNKTATQFFTEILLVPPVASRRGLF